MRLADGAEKATIYKRTPHDVYRPWTLPQEDYLATDWELVETRQT